MVCILSLLQSNIQAKLRPAVWLPGVRNLHSCAERWEIPELVPEESLQKVIDAVARLAEMEDIYLHSVDREKNFVQIFCYTKAGWLDVVEIDLYPGRFQGTQGNARSFSTGLLPVWVPLSFLLNSIFFFVPFYDRNLNRNACKASKMPYT
ncbi:uncharacterized protein LOC124433766 [Xenia sp. Carnegie-2017]|uniref:uncharacterized protein LOC124433766 n=1 Tax=Xenia sp. Carnegie-2017 TaxID=2897299 RepID=UPI001F043BDA|nr:uncharacterized protein LOC124433766 [Xenia sp. Carnegie-2017]